MRRAGSAAVYLLFLMLCAEAVLQFYYRATAGQWLWSRIAIPIYQADPNSGVFNRANLDYTHRTNEFRAQYLTNSAGLRVPARGLEFERPKPVGTFRVMLVGASFAYGWGVDYVDTLAGRLEAGLREAGFAGSQRLELINAGVPSLPEADQLSWYRAQGSSYQADLVVLLTYGSLAVPMQQARLQVDSGGFLVRSDLTPEAKLRAQAKRLATAFYGWTLFTRLRGAGGISGAGRAMQNARAFSPATPEVISSLAHYGALREAVEATGARLVILFYPLSYVVHPEDAPRWRHLGVTDIAAQAAFDEALCAELRGNSFECVNGTGGLLRAARDSAERLYYWLDIHWTARGGQIAARHALEYLITSTRPAPVADAPAPSPITP